jgi:protein-S-isoprenylcysteine O-methyltransferase Ste14
MGSTFLERGGAWVIGQAGLLLGVVGLGLFFHSGSRSFVAFVLGAGCIVVGAVFGIAGALALGHNLTPFPKPAPHAQLVRHGIYARIRHPLYTSVVFISIGWALVWHSWPALLAALALAPFFGAKARREERWLGERFPEYVGYLRDTRRFIPWVY